LPVSGSLNYLAKNTIFFRLIRIDADKCFADLLKPYLCGFLVKLTAIIKKQNYKQ
jgi:hypothetical protein